MKVETFFEKYELFADAPNAVEKMRTLVLALAVRGRLIEQALSESAEDLTQVVERDRQHFAKANGSRARALPAIAEEDAPFELPSNWIWVRLGELCRVQAGFAFSSSHFTEASSGVPLIRIRDITADKTVVHYTGEYRSEFLVNTGDYLIGMDGNFTISKWKGPRALLNQRVSRLQWFSKHVQPLFFAIATQHRLRELQGTKAYTTVDHLSTKQIEEALVPFPPEAEQKRIVAKVDELMALCDRLEEQQKERETKHAALVRASLARFTDAPTPANLNFLFHKSYTIPPADLRKTILTLAAQGKLVPSSPRDDSVDDLLGQVRAQRLKLGIEFSTAKREDDTWQDLAYDLPAAWRWRALGEILIFGPTNGFSPKAVSYETPVKSLTLTATTSGRFNGQYSKFIDANIPKGSSLWLRDGDILVQRGNTLEYVGVAAVYRGPDHRFVYPDLMMKLRVADMLIPEFIHIAMSAEAARNYLRCRATGTSGSMPKINQRTLVGLPIPIPPLAEQHRIVAKIDQLMALVDQYEAQLTTAREKAMQLMNAVVAELGSGTTGHRDLPENVMPELAY